MRAQEDQADRAGVKFLTATGQSAKGMYETFKRLADQILYQTALHRSRTCSRIRCRASACAALEGMAQGKPVLGQEGSAGAAARHDLMRAKLYGFMERPDTVARRYPPSDTQLAGALRARHRDLSLRRSARRARADRRADPGAAAKSLFLRAQGPGAAGSRQAGRGDRAAAARRPARAQPGADPDHAGPGADRHARSRARSTRR